MRIIRLTLQGIAIAAIAIVLGAFALGVFAPSAAALTVDEIRAQIKELMAQVNTLQEQLRQLAGQTSSPAEPDAVFFPKHRICTVIYRNLGHGAQGDDVVSLQEFLQSQGYLSAQATGYFGPMTAQAVAKWQSAEGVSAVGSIGPLSRERIKRWCNNWNPDRFVAAPERGTAPLTVTFRTNVHLANSQYVADAGDYKIVFGDGSESLLPCTGNETFCPGPHTVTHTYTADGTYTAQLVHYGYFGPPSPTGGMPSQVIGRAQIYVGATEEARFSASPQEGPAPLSVDFTYVPKSDESTQYYIEFGDGGGQLMDVRQIYCIRAPCISPSEASHTYTLSGIYTATVSRYIACLYTDPRCMVPQPPPLASVRITVTKDDPTNKPPTISSFSGPTTLAVNEIGTWTIQASDPENDSLSYHVTWGDEKYYTAPMALSAAREAFVQTTTFTHAYNASGTYTVSIIVRDAGGKEAKTSSTVRVGDGIICPSSDAPVCGQPPEPACRHSIPACMMPTPGPQTYGNRCLMNVAGASFIKNGRCDEPVACTADAMQCPDGSWVGRTGPNCEFKCPTPPSGSCTYAGKTYDAGYAAPDASGGPQPGQSGWNSGHLYVCNAGTWQWKLCSWSNMTGPFPNNYPVPTRTGDHRFYTCLDSGSTVSPTTNCPSGYGWCPAGPAGYSCALLKNGSCPITR